MTVGQVAALIAAVAFAVLAAAGTVVLLRLARLASVATGLLADERSRADGLFDQAQAAVDRAHEQLTRTDAITVGMDQVTASMAELSGHVSAMSGVARSVSEAVTAPVTGMAALAYGVRRALLVRRSLQATVVGARELAPAGREGGRHAIGPGAPGGRR